MKKLYYYLFFSFYNINKRNVEFKEESANTLLSIFVSAILLCTYLNSIVWFNIRYDINPTVEWGVIILFYIIIWLINRRYFLTKKNYLNALDEYKNSSKLMARTIAILILIGQMALFVYSGVRLGIFLHGH